MTNKLGIWISKHENLRRAANYLIRVFDTTWESKFWAKNSLFFWPIFFHVDLKAIKAFDPVNKFSVIYLLQFLRNVVLKLMPWCQ